MEIARGCSHGCRFCQAGIIYRPVRERSPGRVVSCLSRSLAASGYDEVSLSSLSSGDYSRMGDLIYLLREFPSLSVSFPSLRPDTLTEEMISFISSVRKTGFTIAPEAGTQRLRDIINKRITEQDILDVVERVFKAGWEGIKLYYMIGLPTETDDDIEGIVNLTEKIRRIGRQFSRRNFIHIGISNFIPKPHTPFQWYPQENISSINRKLQILKKRLSHRSYSMKWQNESVSFLEGALSLGGRGEGKVIYEAFRKGSRFDGWSDLFNFDTWRESFDKAGLDPERFIYRSKEFSEVFPWDHLETGVSKDFLWDEYQKSFSGGLTPDCRTGECSECGICSAYGLDRRMPLKSNAATLGPGGPVRVERKSAPKALKVRFRFCYSKKPPIHYLSHLDMNRVFVRALRRACIPFSMSQGFHPHPKIAFGPALSVGMESECEYIDVELDQYMDKDTLIERTNENLPEGIKVTGGRYIDPAVPSLSRMSDQLSYRIEIDESSAGVLEKIGIPLRETALRKITEFLEEEQILLRRVKKNRLVDIRPLLARLELVHCGGDRLEMEMVIKVPNEGSINPREILGLLFSLDSSEIPGIRIIRTGISKTDPMVV
jgi:radical SAM-linked protein